MTWLPVCLMLAIACLYYVFYFPGKLFLGPEKTRAGYLRERKDAAYENLRDLNFEYKAGKVPDAGGALAACADRHGNGAGLRDLAGDGEGVAAGIGEYAVRNADRIAVAAVAIALFGDDRDAPQAVIARRCKGRGGAG